MTRHVHLPYSAQRHQAREREPQQLGSLVLQILDRQKIVKEHRPLTPDEERA